MAYHRAPRVTSPPGRAAPYREPADFEPLYVAAYCAAGDRSQADFQGRHARRQADRRRRDARAMAASDFEFYKEFCKWIKICCKCFLTPNILDFRYVSSRINLESPLGRPFIYKALVKCLPGVQSGG